MDKLTAEINKKEFEISSLNYKITNLEILLEKDFNDWTRKEHNLYGIEEQEARMQSREVMLQLMKKEEQLRGEKLQLLKQKTVLMQKDIQDMQAFTSAVVDPHPQILGPVAKKATYHS